MTMEKQDTQMGKAINKILNLSNPSRFLKYIPFLGVLFYHSDKKLERMNLELAFIEGRIYQEELIQKRSKKK